MNANRQNIGASKATASVGSQKVLFDVPVYRLTKEKYESQQTDFIEKEQKLCEGKYGEEAHRRYPELKIQTESHLWKNFGGNWLYNEIIGFVRLFFFFNEIRGEYFQVEAKRIVRTRRKSFLPIGYEETYPERIPQGSSNQQIFQLILKFLGRIQHEKKLKNRYVDTSILENIGPHVNWNALLEEQFSARGDHSAGSVKRPQSTTT